MSILFLSLDLFSVGGIQRQSRYELRALRQLLPDVDLVACSFAAGDGTGFEDHINVDLVGDGSSRGAKLRFASRVWRLARRRGAQLIICDHVYLGPIAYAYHLMTGTPYWINVHAIEVWGDLTAARRLALTRANRVLSGAVFTRQYLARRYPELDGRLAVMGDCVDLERFLPGPADPGLLVQLGLPSGPKILTVSRLQERSKGHDTVMDAVARLRDRSVPVTYLVVGDGPDLPRLKRMAREKGLEDSVRFLGRIPDACLPLVYRLCDVFVLVSRFSMRGVPEGEGIPLVVLEAQATGKPAITGKCDGSAESLVDGETGLLVDPADPAELADALERLIRDADLRERMGKAARAHVEQQFSFPAFAGRIGDLLAEATPRLAARAMS